MAQIPLGSTRLDTFDFIEPVEPVERVETSVYERVERDEPRCSNMADDERAIVFACTSLVVFMLLHTQILFCFVK